MRLGTALATLPLVSRSTSASTSAANALVSGFHLRRSLQDDDDRCAREDQRAQECGAGPSTRRKCCSNLMCSDEKNSVRCVKGENTAELTSPTNEPTSPPISRIPTQQPTAKADRIKSRTWTMVLAEDRLDNALAKHDKRRTNRKIMRERDPMKFTEMPSAAPSSGPSAEPTAMHSASPSGVPTVTPSYSPTNSPTKERRDECKIEMYYEKKWCWHDDARNADCDINYQFCIDKSGDELLMEDCGGSEFAVIGFTVRPKNDKKKCWTRRGDGGIRLDDCDDRGDGKWKDQQWAGVCQKKPHMITPLDDKKWCLTQGHEPRNGERLKLQECDKVDNSKTHLWIRK